jgi:DNA repair exonuclease SbcCD ATPase subunit
MDITTLLVAAAGVAGTLTSPVLSQRLSMRAKQQELDHLHQQRQEEREAEKQLVAFVERREAYTALNTTARSYRQALKNYVYERTDESRTELERAREVFRRHYSEGQMIMSDALLEEAKAASSELTAAYGRVKRFTGLLPDDPAVGEQLTELLTYLDVEVYNQIWQLRKTMRVDLGVSDW